tara:strand:- start:1916 stop:2221 length:306 start_codon:yes stop_codon:yes gene_type:complete
MGKKSKRVRTKQTKEEKKREKEKLNDTFFKELLMGITEPHLTNKIKSKNKKCRQRATEITRSVGLKERNEFRENMHLMCPNFLSQKVSVEEGKQIIARGYI